MANDSTIKSTPAGEKDIPPHKHTNPIQGMEELTPLQRQRLDAAVMMLVNYLVSAPTSDT